MQAKVGGAVHGLPRLSREVPPLAGDATGEVGEVFGSLIGVANRLGPLFDDAVARARERDGVAFSLRVEGLERALVEVADLASRLADPAPGEAAAIRLATTRIGTPASTLAAAMQTHRVVAHLRSTWASWGPTA